MTRGQRETGTPTLRSSPEVTLSTGVRGLRALWSRTPPIAITAGRTASGYARPPAPPSASPCTDRWNRCCPSLCSFCRRCGDPLLDRGPKPPVPRRDVTSFRAGGGIEPHNASPFKTGLAPHPMSGWWEVAHRGRSHRPRCASSARDLPERGRCASRQAASTLAPLTGVAPVTGPARYASSAHIPPSFSGLVRNPGRTREPPSISGHWPHSPGCRPYSTRRIPRSCETVGNK